MPLTRRLVRVLNRPGWSWTVVGVLAAYALVRWGVAVREPTATRVVTAVGAATVAVLLHRVFLSPPRPPVPRTIEDAAGRGTELTFHARWHALVLAVLMTTVALLLAVAHAADHALWAFAAIFFAFYVPARAVGVLRRPRLVLTADGVSFRGASVLSSVAWDDVATVGRDAVDRGLAVVVVPRAGAASWRHRRSWVGRLLQERTADQRIELEVVAERDLDTYDAVGPWVQHYLEHPADRTELGTAAAADRLHRLRSVPR